MSIKLSTVSLLKVEALESNSIFADFMFALQEVICPNCQGGFVEKLEGNQESK